MKRVCKSYVGLRGCWCDIIVINARLSTFSISADHFLKHHMKIQLGDLNAEVVQENIFKLTVGNDSLHQASNDNGIRIVNFATSKI